SRSDSTAAAAAVGTAAVGTAIRPAAVRAATIRPAAMRAAVGAVAAGAAAAVIAAVVLAAALVIALLLGTAAGIAPLALVDLLRVDIDAVARADLDLASGQLRAHGDAAFIDHQMGFALGIHRHRHAGAAQGHG